MQGQEAKKNIKILKHRRKKWSKRVYYRKTQWLQGKRLNGDTLATSFKIKRGWLVFKK